MIKNTGKAMPKHDKVGKLTGSILSEKPATNIRHTVATLAPAIRLVVNCFSCLIMSYG